MSGAIPPLLQYAFMVWCSVKKHGDSFIHFTFTFYQCFKHGILVTAWKGLTIHCGRIRVSVCVVWWEAHGNWETYKKYCKSG